MKTAAFGIALAVGAMIAAANLQPPAQAAAAAPELDSMLVVLDPPRAPDSTVWLATRVYPRNMTAGDSVRFTYWRNDTLLNTRRWTRTWDSLRTAAPAYGQVARFRGCGQVIRWADSAGVRVQRLYPQPAMCWDWSYTRPPLPIPDPGVDSVIRVELRVQPLVKGGPVVTLAGQAPTPLNQVQLCAFARLKSGARVKYRQSTNNPTCELLYQAWVRSETTSPLLGGSSS